MKRVISFYNNISQNCLLIILAVFGIINSLTNTFKFLHIGTTIGYIYRAISLFIFIMLILPILFLKRKKFTKTILLISIGYLLLNLLVTILSPIIYKVDVSLLNYALSFVQSIINLLCIYLIFYFFKFSNIKEKELSVLYYLVIGFVSFLCLYTYIFQLKDIINTFKPITDECKMCAWNADVTSIYDTKTVYGFMLFVGTVFSIFYALLKKKYLHLLFAFFFIINIVISRSKTSLLSIMILCFMLFVYYFKKNKGKIFAKLYIWIIGVALILVFTLLIIFKVGTFFENINYFIKNTILGDGVVVVKMRFERWGNVIKTMKNPISILFGFGERVNNPILQHLIGYGATDSGYVYAYSAGGLFYLTINLLVFIFIFKNVVKSKNNFTLIYILCLLINFFFEENFLIGISYNQIFPLIGLVFVFKVENLLDDKVSLTKK